MQSLDELLEMLWEDYSTMNKQAGDIHKLLTSKGETIINDHIAFRTYNIKQIGINVLAQFFLKHGYVKRGEYEFKEKKLFANHFEHENPKYPRIFISELKLEELSESLQKTVRDLVKQIPLDLTKQKNFLVSGAPWKPVSFATYNALKTESEYAAWMSVFGFRVNHFTVLINALKNFDSLGRFNQYLKDSGFTLNASGGEIKGTPADYLEQSSTMAHPVKVKLSDGEQTVPGCYYEFAKRYPLPNGKLFMGFVAKSADKIFESTDNKKK